MAGGKLTRASDCHLYLLVMQDMIDVSRLPQPYAIRNANSANVRLEQSAGLDPLAAQRYQISINVIPTMRAGFEANARTQALRDLLLVAIAAKRYRLARGEYPPDLEALGEFLGAVPIDPYDGEPLRMVRDEQELVLYSIGRNGRDDGGQSVDPSEPDIVVRLK
jgi:hypothetical protein